MLACNEKLLTAIASDYDNTARHLIKYGFVSEQIALNVPPILSTPHQKATILVAIISERIYVAPQQFSQLVKLFSLQRSTKDAAEMLNSAYNGKPLPTHEMINFQ